MSASLIASAGALIARLTPNTPPAAWMPYVSYASEATGAIVILAVVSRLTRSWLPAAAAAIAFVATANVPENIGPLAIALAIVGTFFGQLFNGRRSWWVLVLLVAGAVTGVQLLAWIVIGLGFAVVGDWVGTTKWRGLAAPALVAVLTLVMITAPLPVAATSVRPPLAPLGHDRVTLNAFRALISNIPSGSSLVDDGPVTRMLLDAMMSDLRRAHVEIAPIKNDAAEIRLALATRRVFALPHAQAVLQLEGFRITDGLHVADRGLAEVERGGACVTAADQWQNAAALTGRTSLAFAASNDDRRGPVVIYLTGDTPIHINAVNWPPRTLRGFSPRTFDLNNEQDRRDLEQERAEDAGPGTLDLTGRASVTRVALWRMPDAALALPIELSAPATYAAVKLSPEARGAVSVCPAFPATVSAIR